jgi:dihydrolipoamide dehydrogenase
VSNTQSTQLAVIGGGPGGYPAAFRAADLGMDVTVVDREENPGGVCLFRGCIPSKALLHITKLKTEVEEASETGLHAENVSVDLDALRDWKNRVVKRLTGGLGQLAEQRGIRFIRGHARLLDAHSLEIDLHEGGTQKLEFEQAILAAGSRPGTIPGLPDTDLIMTSREALELPETPERLLLIGGGYIGLELGQVYAALGSKVTCVEMMSNLLPEADQDLVKYLDKRVRKQFEAVYTETMADEITEEDGRIKVKLKGDGAPDENEQTFDRVLVSVGRKPLLDDCGLENTDIEIGDDGFVMVDAQRRTAHEHIFAIGDITGQPMLAHKATHEGRVAAEAAAGRNAAWDPYAIPAVVFSDPEIAWAGLTETEAKRDDTPYKLGKFPWGASGRALTLGRPTGVTKLLVDPDTERILGAGMAGMNAGEIIGMCTVAIEMGAVAEDLGLTIQVHPTLCETVMEAAESIYGNATHFFRRRGK